MEARTYGKTLSPSISYSHRGRGLLLAERLVAVVRGWCALCGTEVTSTHVEVKERVVCLQCSLIVYEALVALKRELRLRRHNDPQL
jgi:hypothetical protein